MYDSQRHRKKIKHFEITLFLAWKVFNSVNISNVSKEISVQVTFVEKPQMKTIKFQKQGFAFQMF